MIRKFIKWQISLSQKFNKLLPRGMLVFGTWFFNNDTMPKHMADNMVVYDIGGGKWPNIPLDLKEKHKLRVTGVDIAEDELKQAPEGQYDATIVADITAYNGEGEGQADLVISRALLEHVSNTEEAVKNIAAMTKPGGKILIFVPCSRAWYSFANLLLPESWKLKLLNMTFPDKMHEIGFKAYYDRCTPKHFRRYADQLDLEVKEVQIFWNSRYFEVFTPFHIFWRLYQLTMRGFKLENFCETFIIVYEKPLEA